MTISSMGHKVIYHKVSNDIIKKESRSMGERKHYKGKGYNVRLCNYLRVQVGQMT